jgi:N-acetylglucosamine-6-sulfatase
MLVAIAAAVGLGACGRATKRQAGPQPRPNVIVIETDDQTVRSMPVMTHVGELLAQHGVTFDNSLVSLPQCCPSRATLLTGQYAHNHHVLSNSPPSGGFQKLDGRNTLAVWLQRAGYYTALVGKYLNGYGQRDPRQVPPGWSEWFADTEATSYSYFDYTINHDGSLVHVGRSDADYKTDYLTRAATRIIRARAPSSRPFFMWVAFTAPHRGSSDRGEGDESGPKSAVPAPQDEGRFDDLPVPRPPSFNEADVSDKPRAVRNLPPFSKRRLERVEERYRRQQESLLAVDRAVESIVDALDETGDLRHTVIAFTSDNGFFNGDHRFPSGKLLPYEPSIRVPLIIRGPGIPQGQHRSQLVANIDLAPTIVALASARPGRVMDGLSLLPLARDAGLRPGRDLLLESGPEASREGVPPFSGIRGRHYVYVEYSDGERELYDLRRDPWELQNVASNPAYRSIRAALARRLRALRHCRGASCRAGRPGRAPARRRRAVVSAPQRSGRPQAGRPGG